MLLYLPFGRPGADKLDRRHNLGRHLGGGELVAFVERPQPGQQRILILDDGAAVEAAVGRPVNEF
jgi:hypothetical protein